MKSKNLQKAVLCTDFLQKYNFESTMLTSPTLRKKFLTKILSKAISREKEQNYTKHILENLSLGKIEYKHCQKIAELMDWEANSVARLFGINASFQPTQLLNKSSEKKILQFLEEKNIRTLEKKLILEIAVEEIQLLLQAMK